MPARGVVGPHFGPEQDRVYVYSDRGLSSLRFDGTDRRAHIKIVGTGWVSEPTPGQDARISPDGRYALALVHQQLYVVAVPPHRRRRAHRERQLCFGPGVETH